MKQAICSFIYHKILGWKAEVSVPDFDKCIICAAPHTTNWDLFIGKLFISAIGRESGFMMKKEWFFFPLGILFRWMGGIPVHRDKRTSMVDQVIKQVNASEKFHLAITPEGTRSAKPELEKGILLHSIRGKHSYRTDRYRLRKEMYNSRQVYHTQRGYRQGYGEIKLYFKDFKGKHPHKFVLGDID